MRLLDLHSRGIALVCCFNRLNRLNNLHWLNKLDDLSGLHHMDGLRRSLWNRLDGRLEHRLRRSLWNRLDGRLEHRLRNGDGRLRLALKTRVAVQRGERMR